MEEGCPGRGKCHGCLGWCDWCGDVEQVCDFPGCMEHMPCEYPGCGLVGRDGRCWWHHRYDPDEVARAVLDS